MHYHNPYRKNSTVVTQATCAVLFLLFAFCWLFWFQADLMAVAQHVLSGGATHYNRTIGTAIIITVLMLLQRLTAALTRLSRHTHALTYMPSMLVLALLGDIQEGPGDTLRLATWRWAGLAVLLGWAVVVFFARRVAPSSQEKEPAGLFSRQVWVNVLLLVTMMLGVAAIGNTHAVLHFRAHAEVALSEGDTSEALRAGNRSLETDEHLTMLRAYALSRRNELGDRLFHYPIKGKGCDLLPLPGSSSHLLLLPEDSLWHHLGARPKAGMDASHYLRALEKDSMATKAVADYVLCTALIDRDLDAFVGALGRLHWLDDTPADSLQRHYREALILYTHLRAHPLLVYHHAVMDEDWDNLQELERQHPDTRARKAAVMERYRNSYWYYYFYDK